MAGRYKKYFRSVLIASDIVAITAVFFFAFSMIMGWEVLTYNDILLLLEYVGLYLLVAVYSSVYSIHRREQKRVSVFHQINAIAVSILLLEGLLAMLGTYRLSPAFHIQFYILVGLVLPALRFGTLMALRYYRMQGYNFSKVMIIGYTESAKDVFQYFEEHPQFGYKCIGILDEEAGHPKVIGKTTDWEKWVETEQIDEVFCCISKCKNDLIAGIMAHRRDVALHWLPEVDLSSGGFRIDLLGDVPVLLHQRNSVTGGFWKLVKRLFDIVFSLIIIVAVLSWLIPLLTILIKLESPGPAIFKQRRTGLNNKPFWCYKFRSMRGIPDKAGLHVRHNEDRVTPLGRFLRKTNLDEMPQFINVFLGHMSVVGPRPHMIEHTEHYASVIDQFMLRHIVKPGITGLSQVKGFRGEIIHPIMMKSRIKEDLYYMMNWSFLLDLKIILLTVLNMIKGEENAY